MNIWVDQVPLVSTEGPSGMTPANRLEEEPNAHTREQALTTVFFARCPPATSEAQILELFSHFGQVEEVNVYRRWQSAKTSKGCGFVRFSDPKAAAAALEALNGKHMFESSEVPMVVEWIDPARLANRQRLHSGKPATTDLKTRQASYDASLVALSAPARQPQQLPHGYRSASGQVSDNSSMSCIQLNSVNSGSNSFLDDSAAWLPHQQAVTGCPPVHVVPMIVQSSAQMVGGLGLQPAGDWVVHAAAPGLPAQPLGTNNMMQTNSPSISTAYSGNQPGVVTHVVSNPPSGQFNIIGNGGGMLQAVPVNTYLANGHMLLCGNLSGPVMVVNDATRRGNSHPPGLNAQLGSAGAAAHGINAAAATPAGAIMTTAAMLDAGHGNAVVLTGPGQSVYGQQLQQGQVFPAMQACQTAGSARGGGVLQPLTNAHSSNSSGIGLQCDTYNNNPAGQLCPQPMMAAAPAAGISAVNSSSIIKLNIPPSAAPAIVNKLELLNELSGVAVALVANGNQGLQLHMTGNLAELNTAYQLVGLLNLTDHQ